MSYPRIVRYVPDAEAYVFGCYVVESSEYDISGERAGAILVHEPTNEKNRHFGISVKNRFPANVQNQKTTIWN